MDPVSIPLLKPIRAHGKDVESLDLRPLTTADLIECGHPYSVVDGGGQRLETRAIAALISKMAGVPMGSVHAMDPRDFQKCLGAITGFLVTSTETADGSDTTATT